MRAVRTLGAALAALVLTTGMGALVPPVAGADSPERATTLADQTGLNVTVYNGTSSLVHDRRRVTLDAGVTHLAWRDVGAQIEPTSSLLTDLTAPGATSILEQNFDFDTLGASAILHKFVGRDVVVVHRAPSPGEPRRETAELLTLDEGMVLKYRDRVETALAPDSYLEFPALPPDLRDRPTLVLDLESATAGSHVLDLAYLTGGLSWQADYTATLARDETHLDLNGTITLTNKSGTSFRDANLQLVAGNVHEAPPSGEMHKAMVMADTYAPAAALPPRQENLFDYHLYTLPRATSILDNQTKQIAFLGARDVPVKISYEVRSDPYVFTAPPTADLGTNLPVATVATFANKGGDLGVPLPAGTIRAYEYDAAGTSLYLASDALAATPKNEDVRIALGTAFDLGATRTETAATFASKCATDRSYRIALENAKDAPQDVRVIEPIPGQWSILRENLPHDKSSSETATWTLRVPSDGTAVLNYTVRIQLCS